MNNYLSISSSGPGNCHLLLLSPLFSQLGIGVGGGVHSRPRTRKRAVTRPFSGATGRAPSRALGSEVADTSTVHGEALCSTVLALGRYELPSGG